MIEERLYFPSQGLRLEGCLTYPATALPVARLLICPPHPFLGGEMDNNVVTALANHLGQAGMAVLRFNYRGIGASETDRQIKADLAAFWRDSTCSGFEAAMNVDCLAACSFLEGLPLTEAPLLVVGYSYGALPALFLLGERPLVRHGVMISPPLVQWTIPEAWVMVDKPKSLLYATGDFSCPLAAVQELEKRLSPPKTSRSFADCDHFFRGREQELAQAVAQCFE